MCINISINTSIHSSIYIYVFLYVLGCRLDDSYMYIYIYVCVLYCYTIILLYVFNALSMCWTAGDMIHICTLYIMYMHVPMYPLCYYIYVPCLWYYVLDPFNDLLNPLSVWHTYLLNPHLYYNMYWTLCLCAPSLCGNPTY
jgi:hypothetical protein